MMQTVRYVLWESEHKSMKFGKARTRMTLAKAIAVTIGFLTSSVPAAIWKAAFVLLFFLAVDYLANYRANRVCHETDARSEAEMFGTKVVQYVIILALCIGGTILSGNPYFVRMGLVGCGGVEFVEMLRQLGRLERCGGVKMPYMRKLLQLPARLFYDETPEETDRDGK